MPTYRNTTTETIPIFVNYKSYSVGPGEELELEYYINESGLNKISDLPYYNPISEIHSVSSIGIGDDQTILLDYENIDKVRVWKVAGANVSVFIQSISNTPSIAILPPGYEIEIDLDRRCDRIILQFDAAGTCELIEIKPD